VGRVVNLRRVVNPPCGAVSTGTKAD
jgi:hypothetical protein